MLITLVLTGSEQIYDYYKVNRGRWKGLVERNQTGDSKWILPRIRDDSIAFAFGFGDCL